jgi:ribonucleotide monophosphatase NagD (HAD superfamily)
MAEAVAALVDAPPQDCLITGDRLETDVQMGLLSGMDAALALTGATSEAVLAVSSIQPTYVLRRMEEILPEGL